MRQSAIKLLDWWKGATAAPFDPASLAPAAWWDSRTADMAADGSLWTSRTGSYNLTASGAARPTKNASARNGLPGFVFDGVANLLAGSGITQIQGSAKGTIWMVGQRAVMSNDDGTTSNTFVVVHYAGDDKVYGIVSTGSFTPGNSTPVTNAFHYIVMIFDGTQATNALKVLVYVDGVQQTMTFTGTVPSNISAVIQPRMGNFYGNFQVNTMCEAGVIGRAISGSELAGLNGYLSAKYAL